MLWLREGLGLPLLPHDGDQTLTLPPLAPSDGGNYTCIAASDAGQIGREFTITVFSEYSSVSIGGCSCVRLCHCASCDTCVTWIIGYFKFDLPYHIREVEKIKYVKDLKTNLQ